MNKLIRNVSILIFLLIVLYFYPLPYYVTSPGSVEALAPIVKVEEGYKEKGSFSLVTIYMSRANVFSYLNSKIDPYIHLHKKEEIMDENETDEEYDVRSLKDMDDAKTDAMITAFTEAGTPFEVIYNGIYVLHVEKEKPAYGKIKPGDRIVNIDNVKLEKQMQYREIFNKKKIGDKVKIGYVRGKKEYTVDLKLAKISNGKPGIGIALVEDKKVKSSVSVEIESEEIGGPSAGLMFTLEIFNQLTKKDYTKGYKIAGTGSIDELGNVGAIGGIDQKVVAASENGAKIFFAPLEYGNYKTAVKTAKNIKTKMKIVPVKTFDDAITYLERLK
ncbi:MAG: secreted protein containing a domain [Bacillales bacterium]|jgi:PDZ domain-containing protein|nr:secreted protein containing a domain [Bacillales bacterium]